MKPWAMIAGIAAWTMSSGAYAQTWKTQPKLVKERSTAACEDTAGAATFTVDDRTFLYGSTPLRFPIAADGKVDANYVSRGGNRLRIHGNVNTKQFELVNTDVGCTFVFHVLP